MGVIILKFGIYVYKTSKKKYLDKSIDLSADLRQFDDRIDSHLWDSEFRRAISNEDILRWNQVVIEGFQIDLVVNPTESYTHAVYFASAVIQQVKPEARFFPG